MRTSIERLLWLLALVLLSAFHAYAGDREAGSQAPSTNGTELPSAAGVEAFSVTQHLLTIGGKSLAYTATAGHLPLTDERGKLQANIFFVAYVRADREADPLRPITFAFNGGPGASSMWLHLGVGPRRVVLPADGTALPESTVLAENEATWLSFTDLVFVDPVGTGYSRAADGVDAKQFYEVERDIQAAAAFLRRYVTRYQRWLSPKFIVGESYGTTRAAVLANRLQETVGINLAGVMLVSSVLDFQTIAFEQPNVLPYVLALPSYAAATWYHGKRTGELTDTIRAAEQWAMTDYLLALAKGDAVPESERARVAERLAEYTGLDGEEVLRRRLRVGPRTFGRQVLRSTGRIVGRFDSRVSAAEVSRGSGSEFDPSFFLVTGPLVEALNDYLRGDLQYRSDLRYEHLSREANQSWNWGAGGQGYLYVADELAEAMSRDPRLRVFAAAGYYDLATPYAAQRYTLDHMPLERGLRSNLTFIGYPSGHMIYTDPSAAAKLQADVEAFVRCAVAPGCEVQKTRSAVYPSPPNQVRGKLRPSPTSGEMGLRFTPVAPLKLHHSG
jgi:carboxypeptidase C (cathepsin A)